ncbi:hypothetical protein [Lentzea sp. NEAU-D7]|uniref:hypothetical protein n=1 Tax=Lentzea sp. NEAU-D7 TaxID=2994667 RepID=UPI00224AE62B|nr:hypothetical protein [Lentzea sp. NEAU-D7]MCX2951625.1 hypothetical protein [Lentzea sp. NEAU-D7]
MTLTDYLAIGAILVAIPATWAGWSMWRTSKRSGGRDRFRDQLRSLRDNQRDLTRRMLAVSPEHLKQPDLPVLAKPEWASLAPFDLADVKIEWLDEQLDDIAKFRRQSSKVLAKMQIAPITRYSTALIEIIGLTRLFDGVIYRLIEVELTEDTKRMVFAKASYFADLDTSEVLAFEAQTSRRRPYRRRLRDPFDFRKRVAGLGIDTLTIRRNGDQAGFFLHQRDPTNVVNNASMIGLIPAGEFTPSDVSSEAVFRDLSLWRNIMREYAEEMLGVPDAQGQGGRWIDYASESPYRELEMARVTGKLQVKILGLGIDPLPWKTELLTVCVIDAEVFDEVFAPVPARNEEGTVIAGDHRTGLPFDEATVERYCRAHNVSPNTEACLRLAWQHRAALGLG